ncbi:MAG TPA: 5'-deoxynucleotidase, partial [Clostridia bacterium]|nr:5'-deoxynucleotidase [Clostridia bacterium]
MERGKLLNNIFFAYINRMKYINRWGLMRNTDTENIQEHSLQVAILAHALCIIKNKYFGGNINADRSCVYALYHDANEIITGDLPTPVKYFNPQIKESYRKIE